MSGPDIAFFGSISNRVQEIGLYRANDQIKYIGKFCLWMTEKEYCDVKLIVSFIAEAEYTDDPALKGFYAGVFQFSTALVDGYGRPSIEVFLHDVDGISQRIAQLHFENKVLQGPDIELSWRAEMKGFFRRNAEAVWGDWTSSSEAREPIGRREFPIFSLRLAAAT